MSLLRSSNCKGLFVTINIALLTERWRYHCLNNSPSRLTICATLETTRELLDPENHEILFAPGQRLAGHHWLHRSAVTVSA